MATRYSLHFFNIFVMSTNHYPSPRTHRLPSLLVLFTTITILLLSCSKDESRDQGSVPIDPKFEPYYRLLSFWEKTQDQVPEYPVLMPRSDYSGTDIRDYIEGTLNMVYTDNNLTWEDYDRNTEYYSISLISGYAQEANVFEKYDEVLEDASAYFYSIEEEDKFPYLFDVAITYTSSSSLQFSVTSIIGKYHRDPTPFGSSDYWDVRVEAGHCAPMSGGSGYNASDQICNALDDYYTPYYCHVWTDVVEVFVDAFNVNEPDLLDYG